MKTTIDLPEDMLHRAKIVAAQRKTTLRELVCQGLDYTLRHPSSKPEDARKTAFKKLLKQMRASNTESMKPLKRSEIYDR